MTSSIALASSIGPFTSATSTGMYGREICWARNETKKMAKIRRVARSPKTPRTAPKARSIERPVGMTSGRTSTEPNVTRTAVPSESSAEMANTAGSPQPSESTTIAPRTGPMAKPIGPALPNQARATPIRPVGAESRIAPSMTPALPSWRPTRSMLRARCRLARQGDADEDGRLDEGAPDDDDLAAVLVGPDAPQRDEGHADDEDERPNRPTNWSRSASGTPIDLRSDGMKAKIWLTPMPSTQEVMARIASRTRQSCLRAAGGSSAVVAGLVIGPAA